MRMFISALFSAGALLPTLGHATTALPDPTDAAASVPAVSVPSVFADYHPFQDQKAPTWQELNQAVTSSSRMAGMKMPSGMPGMKMPPAMPGMKMPSGSTDAKKGHSSTYGGPAK
jgi:hypothetical protein